jgi:thymidylate synthase
MPGIVEADTLDDVMRQLFQCLLSEGIPQEATRGKNLEVIGAGLRLRNPRARLSRSETKRKPVSAIAELCWYLSGSDSVEMIAFWVPRYRAEAEDDGRVNGAYGPRLFGQREDAQICRIVEMLSESAGTRRAVIQLFDRKDIAQDVRFKDVPCTSTIQFLSRSDQLHLIVNMRSNDVYRGLPHDVFAFTMLQELVARQLNLELGEYIHLVGSMHLYDSDQDRVRQFLQEGWQSRTGSMRPMPPGPQSSHITDLLQAEKQLRGGFGYADLTLPEDHYWADLARLLALHRAYKQNKPDEARAVVGDIVDEVLSDFAQAAQTGANRPLG